MASLIASAILSGCPSVTDSEVNRRRDTCSLLVRTGPGVRAEDCRHVSARRLATSAAVVVHTRRRDVPIHSPLAPSATARRPTQTAES